MKNNHSQPVYNVLIIGAGQIGAFYDKPDSVNVLSHAHAFSIHPGFNLLGFVDSDISRAMQAAQCWGGNSFLGVEDAHRQYPVDLICLAVPDEYHYQYLKGLAKDNIKLVFAEKPLTKTLEEALEIKQRYSSSSISVAVNYSRRYLPEFVNLRNKIRSGEFGDYLTGTGYYGKGLLHNGSHMIDLLRFLLGEITGQSILKREYDYYPDDFSAALILDINNHGKFYMQNVDCRAYTVFEMDLMFSSKRIRIIDSGFCIEEYGVADSPTFSGYKMLQPSSAYNTSLSKALAYAAENIYEYLSEGKMLNCTLDDAYQVMKTYDDIVKGQEP